MNVKYPDVKVKLVGEDGNAYLILGRTVRALKKAGHADAVEVYKKAATAGDYDNLLRVTMETVDVD